MSTIKPMLDAHEVRLVGIGLEEFGKQEFIDGGFFKGGKSDLIFQSSISEAATKQ